MVVAGSSRTWVILLRASSRLCAIPLIHVIETFRPLPVRALSGSPAFISGMAIVRGRPTPVVDLGRLLADEPSTPAGRYVTLRSGPGPLALAVDSVLGVRELAEATLDPLPSILKDLDHSLVERIGTLDSELLMVLRASRVLSEDHWRSLTAEGAAWV
jgi:purine-binding chemotaxis protein CheW